MCNSNISSQHPSLDPLLPQVNEGSTDQEILLTRSLSGSGVKGVPFSKTSSEQGATFKEKFVQSASKSWSSFTSFASHSATRAAEAGIALFHSIKQVPSSISSFAYSCTPKGTQLYSLKKDFHSSCSQEQRMIIEDGVKMLGSYQSSGLEETSSQSSVTIIQKARNRLANYMGLSNKARSCSMEEECWPQPLLFLEAKIKEAFPSISDEQKKRMACAELALCYCDGAAVATSLTKANDYKEAAKTLFAKAMCNRDLDRAEAIVNLLTSSDTSGSSDAKQSLCTVIERGLDDSAWPNIITT